MDTCGCWCSENSSWHFIVIYAIDPNSKEKSLKLYPLQTILDELAGSHAFLVCGLQEQNVE